MRSLKDLVTPRDEVLHTTLDESIFAANLADALRGDAPDIYSVPSKFFQRTFPTAGLTELLRMALGRLSGMIPDEAPVLRIDTNLGGGKTHNLIALCHACAGGMPQDVAETLLGDQAARWLSSSKGARVGAFVGTDWSVAPGAETLWGSLARSLGGSAGYDIVRTDDESRTAPGVDKLKRLLGHHPNLIVIDEIAQYLEKANAVPVGESTLSRQVLAFIMDLCEAVSQAPRSVAVITTTQESRVFQESTEALLDHMSRLEEITGRQAHLIQPATESDIPGMLSRRLFARVDDSEIDAIAEAYRTVLEQAEDLAEGWPAELVPGRLARRMEATWPFHPELVAFLDKRLSTVPQFQRTRGALRLLARTVQLLWSESQSPEPFAIHPFHLDLADEDVVRPQLTSGLQRHAMDQVARADIANRHDESRASLIDEATGFPYARRAGTTCFLESLVETAANPTQGAILGSVLQPGDDSNLLLSAWERLCGEAWYLHEERGGYRFKTEPSLSKMIQDQEDRTSMAKARAAAVDLLEDMFISRRATTAGGVFTVCRTWRNEKAADNARELTLCLYSWSQFPESHGVGDVDNPPDIIQEQWERTDAGGVRQFRNRIVFVAPDRHYCENMFQVLRRGLALQDLAANRNLTAGLGAEALQSLQSQWEKQQLDMRVAVANVMSLVWYPFHNDRLEVIRMPVNSTARAKRNQIDVVFEELESRGKFVPTDRSLDPAVVKQQLGQRLQQDQGCSVLEIERIMARNGSSRILLDRRRLVELLWQGTQHDLWDYKQLSSDQWVTLKQGTKDIVTALDGDAVFPPGTAPDPNIGNGGGDDPAPIDPIIPTRFTTHSSPGAAISTVVEEAQAAGGQTVTEIQLEWSAEDGTVLSCLQATYRVLSQMGMLKDLHLDLYLKAETRIEGRNMTVEFRGDARRAQPFSEPAKELVRQGIGSTIQATTAMKFSEPVALESDWKMKLHEAIKNTKVSQCAVTLTTAGSDSPQTSA